MSEQIQEKEPQSSPNFDVETPSIVRTGHYNLPHEIKTESLEHKEGNDPNTDSNKSNFNFQTPSNVHSSSGSVNRESDYMTPKSRNNLNLLFSESNGKKSVFNQRRLTNHVNALDSPFTARGFINYQNNFAISPIDASKLNHNQPIQVPSYQNYSNKPSNFNPHYVFNNNHEGVMSINIHHQHIYGRGNDLENKYSKFNRKIEFQSQKSDSSKGEVSSHSEPSDKSDKSDKSERSEQFNPSEGSNPESYSEPHSEESPIKKPQAILPSSSKSMRANNIRSNPDPYYLTPFTPYTSSYSNNLYNMTKSEYEAKTAEELRNKKNSCNCKKSKCLKLYCECFANGEYCINCNCQDCNNVIGNDEEIESAFKSVKDKNPVAMKFNPVKEIKEKEKEKEKANINTNVPSSFAGEDAKVGCNCTKSNCSKKYCECFKAGIGCNENCRCRDCSNMLEKSEPKSKVNSYKENNECYIVYNYEKFNIEKISVLIENKQIIVEKSKLDLKKNVDNPNIHVKHYNTADVKSSGFVIEVSKNILNKKLLYEINSRTNSNNNDKDYFPSVTMTSFTPVGTKFRKRKTGDDSDFSQKIIKTACETNKKSNSFNREFLGKKLNMEECEKYNKTFLK